MKKIGQLLIIDKLRKKLKTETKDQLSQKKTYSGLGWTASKLLTVALEMKSQKLSCRNPLKGGILGLSDIRQNRCGIKQLIFTTDCRFVIGMKAENKKANVPTNCAQLAHHLQILFAQKILDLFIFECERLIESGISLREFSLFYKLTFDLQVQYRSMKRVVAESQQLLQKAYEPDEGWTTLKMNQLCTMSVRSNKTLMELKSRGILQIDIKHALIMAYLMKLYTECFPFCKQSYDLKEPTRLEKIGFLKMSFPIPFIKDRSTLMRGIGFQNRAKPHKVTIFAEGINQFKEYLQQNKVDPTPYMQKQELLDFKHFVVEMTYLGPKRIEYAGYALIDHHIPILPESLVLFVTKEMGKHIFNKLMKKLQKFEETVWAKEMNENYAQNRYFYDWIANFVNVWNQQLSNKK